MIKIDDRDIKRLEGDLKAFAHRAYPFATKATVNSSAFHAQKEAKEEIGRKMITRNQFSKRSVLVNKTNTLNVNRQAAVVGSIAPYMEDQEFGGTKHKKGKRGLDLPTSASTSQGKGAKPRIRLPTKPNKLENIILKRNGNKARSKKQRNAISIRQAAKSGRKYIFMDLGRKQGIFKIIGGKKISRIDMVHDFSEQSVRVPKNPWLLPAVKRTQKHIPEIYKDALIFQLKRNRLFKG